MIDFHSHILPGMDDGANDIEESLVMLESLKEQGITIVVATPHYRGERSIKSFLSNRQKSYNELKAAMDSTGKEYPRIVLGAEVAISEYILQHRNLERLCIEGTNYILAELPTGFWQPFLYHVLYTLSAQYHLNIIIAHIDRYFSLFGRNDKIMKLIEMQPVFQINMPALMSRRGRKFLKWIGRFNAKVILGTDCHNMKNRKPYYLQPARYLARKYGDDYLNEINTFGDKILSAN